MNHSIIPGAHWPAVMGVLNVTPDSFSDGGHFSDREAALQQARTMVEAGADCLDIGGESTRPGADPVPVQEEIDRVCPVLEAIRSELDIPVSLDTSTPEVMREGARLGATLINDVRALRREGAVEAARDSGLPVCIMHMQGEPATMQQQPEYADDVVSDVLAFLRNRTRELVEAGIGRECLMLDPGFGFGKTLEHNLTLLDRLESITAEGLPVLVGMSRKSMLGKVTGRDVAGRMPASVAAATVAMMKGAAVVRAHDVPETVDAARLVRALGQMHGNREYDYG
jgi:dihydropteroate synthase